MVNPYAQQRLQPKSKSQINIGQSQALKKVDALQNKAKTSEIKKSELTDSDDDSIFRRSSNKFIKSSNEYKGDKVLVKMKREDEFESEEDDDDDVDDDDDDDDEDETSTTKMRKEASGAQTAPSTSRQIGSASSLSKRNKVKFETDLTTGKRPKSASTKADTDDNMTISEDMFNKNLILDIQDLDIEDDMLPTKKKASIKSDKKKSPTKSDRNRKLSKSTISDNIAFSSMTDDDSISSKAQSIRSAVADENDDSELSVQKNLILDVNDLASIDDRKPPSSKLKNVKLKQTSAKTSKPKKKLTREQSSIHTEPDDYESSIATEIKDDFNQILTEKSHASQQIYEYNEDFISETEPQSTSRRTKSSLKQYKRVSLSPKLHAKHQTIKTKTIQTQVGDTDFVDKHDLINSLEFYTPSSYLNTKKAYLNNLNRMIEFNTVNHAVDEMIRMNIQFLKNFLTTQRIMYESELEGMKPELIDH
jgi:hypothetical protein